MGPWLVQKLSLLNPQRAGDELAPLGTVLTQNTPLPPGPYPRGRVDLALKEGGPGMGTQWRTPGFWRRGEDIPDRRCGPEGLGGVTDRAQLGWKDRSSNARVLVFENLMQAEKQTEP